MAPGEPVAVIGAGGHAIVLLEVLRLLEMPVLGVLAASMPHASFELKYLGDSTALYSLPRSTPLIMGIGGSRDTEKRRSQFEYAKSLGFSFPALMHPAATVASDARLGEGAQVMAGAVIQPRSVIGANVLINTGSLIDHDARIGDHAHIAPGAVLAGDVSVGPATVIGTGATIANGVKIGANALIGAGSVVVRDLPDHCVAFGVPCRVVADRKPR